MKLILISILFYFFSAAQVVIGQKATVDKVRFFSDTSIVNATIVANMGKIISQKSKIGNKYNGTFSCRLNDSIDINDPIQIEVRGHSRRDICYMPPLKLNFNYNKEAYLYPLNSLKLVSACKPSDIY